MQSHRRSNALRAERSMIGDRRYRIVTVRSCILAVLCDSQRTGKARSEKRRPSALVTRERRPVLHTGSPGIVEPLPLDRV
jgi:hypothetical protein